MHVIIIGAGEVGRYIADILIEEKHDVFLIEEDDDVVRALGETIDAQVIAGTGVSRDALKRAGIEKADLLLAVTSVDEANLIAALTAERLNSDCRTVARVRNPRLFGRKRKLDPADYGIDMVVGAEQSVAEKVVGLLQYAGAGQSTMVADRKVQLLEFPVEPHSTLPFSSNEELRGDLPERAVVAAVLDEDGKLRISMAEDRFKVGEHVFILCPPGDVNDVLARMGWDLLHVKRVLLIGGGSIGEQVAKALERLRFDVTVIEKKPERAEKLAGYLSRSLVICADGTDPAYLAERIREGNDAVVTLVADDSESLLAAIVAKFHHAKKVIARVDNQDYANVAHKHGVDSLISPRRAIADEILRYVRRSRIVSTTMLGNHEGEIIDFEIDAKSRPELRDKAIAELKLPEGCVMGVVKKSGDFLPPGNVGDARLEPGDHVIVIALREAVPKIEKLFA